MDQKKIILPAAVIVAAAGCLGAFFYYQNQKNASVPAQNNQTSQGPITEEPVSPLRLDYVLNNFGPQNGNTISYFIENKKTCGERTAYLGVAKIDVDGDPAHSQYAKFSIFSDNGQMASSQWYNESNMAFDDSAPFYSEMDLPTIVNDIFAYASKNFNSSEYWNAKEPIILKDVSTGRSTGNYSVIPMEDDNTKTVPCKNFKIVAKTSSTDGYFTACIAKEIGGVAVPLIVSFAFENGQGPSWELKSFSAEKSGIAVVPQCLDPVACSYVAEPSQEERISCNAKNGQIENKLDEKGCITAYKCLTSREAAEEAISRTQDPECEINQTALNKYLECRKNNKPNFEPAAYDERGCLTDLNCR